MANTFTNNPHIKFSDVTGEMTHSASVSFPMPDFSKFALPLVKSTYQPLTAQQIVSVQPMTMPTSQIFYFTSNELDDNHTIQDVKTDDIWKDLEKRLKGI